MRALIRNVLEQECSKHVQRHFDYLTQLHDYARRRSLREGTNYVKRVHHPRWWDLCPQFNPFKVRSKKKLNTYSETLAEKLRSRDYKPQPALIHHVPKKDGSLRRLNIFQIPDAAVSRLVYKSLLHKNVARFSGYAYAYREDKTAHDAVNELFAEWKKLDRVYVAEYDFSKFFDEISHEYLWRVLDQNNFIVSPEERHVIDAFLKSEACEYSNYPAKPEPRLKGIPQGTAVSLFLANIACWELDRELERLGVGFCRYADDTAVWSEDYNRIVNAYYLIDEYSDKMGVPINLVKSQGIHLISRTCGRAEISCKQSIDYLGYQISQKDVSIADHRVAKIKERISFLIYQNLIQPLKIKGVFNKARLIATLDLDYVTTLRQIRYYMYGGLTEDKLLQYIAGRVTNLHFRGVMSYYPIVTNIRQLAILDGWLIYVLRQSLKLRQRLWSRMGVSSLPGPTQDWIDRIERLGSVAVPSGHAVDLRIPRFTLINSAMRRAINRRGITAVASPLPGTYYP